MGHKRCSNVTGNPLTSDAGHYPIQPGQPAYSTRCRHAPASSHTFLVSGSQSAGTTVGGLTATRCLVFYRRGSRPVYSLPRHGTTGLQHTRHVTSCVAPEAGPMNDHADHSKHSITPGAHTPCASRAGSCAQHVHRAKTTWPTTTTPHTSRARLRLTGGSSPGVHSRQPTAVVLLRRPSPSAMTAQSSGPPCRPRCTAGPRANQAAARRRSVPPPGRLLAAAPPLCGQPLLPTTASAAVGNARVGTPSRCPNPTPSHNRGSSSGSSSV